MSKNCWASLNVPVANPRWSGEEPLRREFRDPEIGIVLQPTRLAFGVPTHIRVRRFSSA